LLRTDVTSGDEEGLDGRVERGDLGQAYAERGEVAVVAGDEEPRVGALVAAAREQRPGGGGPRRARGRAPPLGPGGDVLRPARR